MRKKLGIEEPSPQLSVDRAIGHYVDGLDINFDALRSYYDNLPHSNKRRLEGCRIHFSALSHADGQVMGLGVHLKDPDSSKSFDPQAPPANIIIFLGSGIHNSFSKLDETLKHELVHYAQNNQIDKKLSDEELVLEFELALRQGKIAKTLWLAKAAIFGTVLESITAIAGETQDIKIAAGYGLGLAAFDSLAHRKKGKEKTRRLRKELHTLQTISEVEEEATSLATNNPPVLEISPRLTNTHTLVRKRRGAAASNRITDYAHKQLSLTPPTLSATK